MKKSETLYSLIHSLSKNEKRYFKLYASKHKGEKKYIKLFNIIGKQKEYDVAAIKAAFKGDPFVNQLSGAKNYLYNLLLESLIEYKGENMASLKLRKMLNTVEVLFMKEMYPTAIHVLNKAKQLAHETKKMYSIPEILWWERRFIGLEKDNYYMKITLLAGELERALEDNLNTNTYLKANNEAWNTYLTMPFPRNELQMMRIKEQSETHFFLNESLATNFYSRVYFHNYNFVVHVMLGNNSEAYRHAKVLVELFDADQVMLQEEINLYITALHNYAFILLEENKLEGFSEILKRIKKLRDNKLYALLTGIQSRTFHIITELELRACIISGEFEEGVIRAKEAESELNKYENKITKIDQVNIYYNLGMVYFGAHEYHKSLAWFNKLLNEDTSIRQDLYSVSKIIHLIIHSELGNTDLIPYLVKTTVPFLKKINSLYKTENLILGFIQKLIYNMSTKERKSLFIKTRDELLQLKQAPYEKNFFYYFDIISWLNSKIENKTFSEMVKSSQTSA